MKKIITILLSFIFLVGCSLTKEQDVELGQKNNVDKSIENIKVDSNWNIPVKGTLSGVFCGFMDNHSFELLGDDGQYYAVSIVKFIEEDLSYLEGKKTKLTIEYVIEEEGSQLTLLKIIDKN